ncbi:uncharacterized protein LOC131620001 [Vicia villosa]|uniref:uncharacterized protein LOC131620001 n=1 Tax=Vicia villosa TaxID=3911 RepID=UPI00273C7441|nr:uncharacterized protein LOC131620001 [Vicia villosa]
MENNGYNTPNTECVHLLLHFGEESSIPLLNIDPDRYSYFDLVDDISGLAINGGLNSTGLSFSISFCHPTSNSKILIENDSDILDMFKLYNTCSCIHVYAISLVNNDPFNIIISESNEESIVNDELSDYEEKHDLIVFENSDEDKVSIYSDRGLKGKIFAPEFDGKVKLEVGLLFGDVNEFRATLRDFVIQEGFEIKRIKNEKARVTARCVADGCCWRIHASPAPDGLTYKIKSYNPDHSCIRTTKNSNATSTWIAGKLESKLKADPNMSYAGMKQELLDNYGIEPSNVGQLYRAKKKVRQDTKEFHALSYNNLPSWANLALETNPGSIIKLELEPRINQNPIFKRFFVCLNAMKNGFVKGCRPWFGIDGCHLKGPYGGVLLSVVAVDGNKGMFLIAFVVVEVECKDSWMFFLTLLGNALNSIPEWKDKQVTIMSDMQKGLQNAVVEAFPYAKHRYCCNHLLNNFKLKFRTLLLSTQFWAVAMAYNEFMFEKAMEKLKNISVEAANWMLDRERPKNMCARHTIDSECKSDHVTNSVTESFNSWLGDDKKKTILSMIESITCRLMARFQKRYEKGREFNNIVTPKIRKVLDITTQDGRVCRVTYAGDDEFGVKDGYTTFVVNLRSRTCRCDYWRITGLPCKHACACITHKRENVEKFCDTSYTTKIYSFCYNNIIHPMSELDEKNRGSYEQIDPPVLRRLSGRPRVNRKRSVIEGPSGSQDARRSNTVRCGNCKEFGHNILGCQRDKTKKLKKLQVRRKEQSSNGNATC